MVLDVACGSRMFWFNRKDPRAVYCDNRREKHVLVDKSSKGGTRQLIIAPDCLVDFTNLPFPDNHFPIVVFDPPHLISNGSSGWLAKKYGKLRANWQDDIRNGFKECFRVLCPAGTLIFKWNEHEISVGSILALTPEVPLFGNQSGRMNKTHWIVFQKVHP